MDYGRYPNKLKMFRRRIGLTRKKAARLLGYANTSMLSLFENGHSIPSLLQTLKFARLYRVLPHELFDELWNQYQHLEGLSLENNNSDLEV